MHILTYKLPSERGKSTIFDSLPCIPSYSFSMKITIIASLIKREYAVNN